LLKVWSPVIFSGAEKCLEMVAQPIVHNMGKTFNLKIWFLETRPQFLLLPVMLILAGTAVAWYDGSLNVLYALIALTGLLLSHASVNILNDYFDYKSGVDLKTIKTPFSGGSGILPANKLAPRQTLWFGLICLILAVPVGVFFIIVKGWQLLPLILAAAFLIILYTPVVLKSHFPEWSAGLGLGLLPVLGAYFVQTGRYTFSAFAVAVPAGFLVLNLLLLNEFPDAEADMIASRKTLPIMMGKGKAAVAYTIFMALTYLWILGLVLAGLIPRISLLSFLTLPFACKAVRGSFNYHDLGKLIPAMGNNVLTVLGVMFFLGIGYILATIFPVLR
jgi:1,4-dihydroxy-2-naphthoate octaprenyltransferase